MPRENEVARRCFARDKIEKQFLAILRLESGSVGKIISTPFQRNQDHSFNLSGTGDMNENVSQNVTRKYNAARIFILRVPCPLTKKSDFSLLI